MAVCAFVAVHVCIAVVVIVVRTSGTAGRARAHPRPGGHRRARRHTQARRSTTAGGGHESEAEVEPSVEPEREIRFEECQPVEYHHTVTFMPPTFSYTSVRREA